MDLGLNGKCAVSGGAWDRVKAKPATVSEKRCDVAHVSRRRHTLGYVGAVLLLLIIPVKLLRYSSVARSMAVGVAPSLLGPSGLLFLLLSSPGRLSRLTVTQTAILAGTISAGLELVQLLPRPGILNRVRYTFDVLDLLATLGAVGVSSVIAKVVLGERGHGKKRASAEALIKP